MKRYSNALNGCIETVDPLSYFITNDTLLRTVDGCNTWGYVRPYPYNDIDFTFTSNYAFNGNDLFILVEDHMPVPYSLFYLYKSTNLGQNWSFQTYTGASYQHHYIWKNLTVYKNVGFFIDYCEFHPTEFCMKRSTNGGYNWTNTYAPHNNYIINSPSYSDLNPSVVFGQNSGMLIKSADYGANFSNISVNATRVCVVDNSVVIAIYGNQLYRSANLGTNWTTSVFPVQLNSVVFPNVNTGYITGNNGKIFKSMDKGVTWGQQTSPTTDNLVDCNFIDAQTGFAISYNGTVLKTIDGGGPIISNINKSLSIPLNYFLSQNYPNPFNPTTTISFKVASLKLIKLVVFDMLGKEIEILVNEKLAPGTYEVTFDGNSLSSGVYFYRLTTDGFSETKKMLMLK